MTKVGASARELLEIDGRPAAEVYNEWDQGQIRSTCTFDEDGTFERGAVALRASCHAPFSTCTFEEGRAWCGCVRLAMLRLAPVCSFLLSFWSD